MRNEDLARIVCNATRSAFSGIIDLCIEERVEALLIAGDLYDGNQTSMHTARFFARQMQRLNSEGIETFIIRGNHDAESRITRQLVLPPSVKVFGSRVETERFESISGQLVAIHGISFARPHSPESLVGRFPPPVPDAINIGMLHTSLGGSEGHDAYSPCSVQDLEDTGYDYWALGHIHQRAVHSQNATIVMPGIPQGRDIGESGEKSVTLATIGVQRIVGLQERSTAMVRFEHALVDASGIDRWNQLVAAIVEVIEANATRTRAEETVLRLRLTGETELHWRIQRDLDMLMAEAQQAGETVGSVWIDKVENRTSLPGSEVADSGPVAELERLLQGDAELRNIIMEQAETYGKQFAKVLPVTARDVLGRDEATRQQNLELFLEQGVSDALAHLRTLKIAGAA